MSRKTRPETPDKPATVSDLVRVTGLGRDTVYAAIRSGELPGYFVGGRYVVPRAAFEAFCRGEWMPQPKPVLGRLRFVRDIGEVA